MSTTIPFDGWLEEMKQAQAQLERVNQVNAPYMAKNRRIKEINRWRSKWNETHKKQKPLLLCVRYPDKIKGWAQAIFDREDEVKRSLNRKKPRQWKSDIRKLRGPLRNQVACVVWWDYFGGRVVTVRWPHLDEWVDAKYVPVDRELVTRGLHQCGYSPVMAQLRIRY